jgi:prepilin-type N-terminal cleavage/methylation domain-containing protein
MNMLKRDCFCKWFTLIELLIVIAIIAILASLMLPALSRARGVAKMSYCLNTLKQTGYCEFMYHNDSDGWCVPGYSIYVSGNYPYDSFDDTTDFYKSHWFGYISCYAPKLFRRSQNSYASNPMCPNSIDSEGKVIFSTNTVDFAEGKFGGYGHVSCTGYGSYGTWATPHRKTVEFKKPSKTVLYLEAYGANMSSGTAYWNQGVAFRHNNRANLLHHDGSSAQVSSAFSDYYTLSYEP